MSTSRVAFLALLLSALVGAPASAAGLTGRLVFPEGKPAAGVAIRALPFEEPHARLLREARREKAPEPLASVTTAADGRFAISVARADVLFVLETDGGGAVPVRLDGVWEGSETEELPPITLTRGEVLSGKVVDAAGAPIEGAEATLTPGGVSSAPDRAARSTRTGSDGLFRFDAAPPVGSTLVVEKEGLAPYRATALASGARPRPIVLDGGAPVAGAVRRADGRGPAAGVLVRWDGAAATRWVETDADGRFTIPHAPKGSGALQADAGDGGAAERPRLSLPRAAEEKPLVLALVPACAVAGRVVDARTLRPVPRVKVVARGDGGVRFVRSGPDGRYRIVALRPGAPQLTADDPRYVPWSSGLPPLAPGETRARDVVLQPGATLAGKVVTEEGAPIADAEGVLQPAEPGGALRYSRPSPRQAVRSGADGTFRATRLVPGEGQRLTMGHRDFQGASVSGLSLAPGGTRGGVTLVLRRGASLEGRAHAADGTPLPGVAVEVHSASRVLGWDPTSSEHGETTTGADGRFTVAGVPPGEWAVTLSLRGWAREEIPSVKVGEERAVIPLDVTLVPGARISGFVRTKGGAPAEGIFVAARSGPRGFSGNTLEPTVADGAFVIDSLRPGTRYDLTVVGRGGASAQKMGVPAPSEGVELVAPAAGRIAGRVVEDATSRPLTEFTVRVEPDGSGGASFSSRAAFAPKGVHAEDGAFVLDEVPAGSWAVVVQARNFQAARTGGIQVEEGGSRDDVEVRATPGATLSGRVLDARSGRGVPEAAVLSAPASSASSYSRGGASPVTTDADGRYALEGLAPGRYRVTAAHPDYADAVENAELPAGGASVDLKLGSGGSLGGVVVSDSHRPVPDAQVSLSDRGGGGAVPPTTTDAAGRFRFEHLRPGRYDAMATLAKRSSRSVETVLASGETKEDLVLSLAVGVTIRGVVTGLPEELRSRVWISATASDWGSSTDASTDGRFELAGAPAGTITLWARASGSSGQRSTSRQVTVSEGQEAVETELVFEDGFALSGHVTKGGRPLPGIAVSAGATGGGPGGGTTTDDAGAYRIEGLTAGTYLLIAYTPGRAGGGTHRQTVELASDQTFDLEFPTARLAGAVVEAGEKHPLADVDLTLAAKDSVTRQGRSDSAGRFLFADLDATTYTLTAQKSGFLVEKKDVAASDPAGEEVVVELTRGEGLALEAKDGIYGIPLKSIWVRASDPARTPVFTGSVALDSEGRGEIASLRPGAYDLTFLALGYAPAMRRGVAVPSRPIAVAMTPGGSLVIHLGPTTLARGAARLQILTAAGNPYPYGGGDDGAFVLALPERRIENFAPGSYSVRAGTGDAKSFTVQEGQTTAVELP